ncbi:Glutathione-regulated potassium-efflux system protein KefB [Fulvivirga imtechensis AK7]|uniref:Glutathione-regulated potassium-efflux system protein KefB n=1 Tax=Fulvivirga imtechensis AK7 TaxID=1237149 RepID=L8JSU4_9BACT|nr:cation:proton antiporter [Fulvivirga imtechensis]ELR72046.1 Glutathione-regulated potassium-efflux system protein KefB [Fulvivirga imtechensis AK7]
MKEWITLLQNPFYEFAAILMLAALLGIVGKILRQPLIVMFIFLGILVGPSLLDLVSSTENIELLADIGIAILLFIVGLKLDLQIIRSIGTVALITGLGQVIFTSVIGYFIGIGLGFSSLHSFYIAIALTFSSTIIIVKLLSDKKEIDSLHGQIAIGFLIVQDLVVILLMIVLTGMEQQEEQTLVQSTVKTLISGVLLVGFIYMAMRWIIPGLTFYLAKLPELLILFAIAWAVSLDALSEALGFSGEVGAFLAGVSLTSSEFRDVVSSRLVSIRDFLLLFFFVNLGVNINLGIIGSQIPAAVVFSGFVLVGNPLIVLIIMGVMGYRKRTSFLAGLTVAQISEFSLIFAGLGLQMGHISQEVLGLITLVGLITIGLSTYLILYSHQLFEFLSPVLGIFQRKRTYRELDSKSVPVKKPDVIIVGYGRYGSALSELLERHPEIDYVAVDFDPQVVKAGRTAGRNIMYGDLEDPEVLDRIPLKHAKYVIVTIPDMDISNHLVKELERRGYSGKIYIMARHDADRKVLIESELAEILLPHQLIADSLYNFYLKDIIPKEN